MSTARREGQTLYGVTYRDESGRARHVRTWAFTPEEAADQAASHIVGFARLERVIVVTNDPFASPAVSS